MLFGGFSEFVVSREHLVAVYCGCQVYFFIVQSLVLIGKLVIEFLMDDR